MTVGVFRLPVVLHPLRALLSGCLQATGTRCSVCCKFGFDGLFILPGGSSNVVGS